MNFRDTIGHAIETAATGAVGTSTSLMAYMKQVVTATLSTFAGRYQTKATTIDLNQIAGSYDLATGTTQNVIIESLMFRIPHGVDVSDDATITSISIQTDETTPQIFISSTNGAKANLTAEAQLSWDGAVLLIVGHKIQLTIAGGASDAATVCNVVIGFRAVVAGGNLG